MFGMNLSRQSLRGAGFLVLLALHACSPSERPGPVLSAQRTDSMGIEIVMLSGTVSQLPVWSLPPEPLRVIRGDQPPYLSRIGEIGFLSNGDLIVEDNQSDELRRFDGDGGVALLGGAGEGPGEFQNLTEMTIGRGDTIFAFDRRLYRMTGLTPDGEVVHTLSLGRDASDRGQLTIDAFAMDSQTMILHMLDYDPSADGALPRREPRRAVIYSIDGEGNDRADPIQLDGGYSIEFSGGSASGVFSNEPLIATGRDRVVYSDGRHYDLIVGDANLQTRRIIRWPGADTLLSPAEIEAARDSVLHSLKAMREQAPELARQFEEEYLRPDMLGTAKPILSKILVDPSDRIWLMAFAPRAEWWSQGDRWHVLGIDGTPIARIRLPPRSRLAEVGKDRIAVIRIDDLDVQHLEIYSLDGFPAQP